MTGMPFASTIGARRDHANVKQVWELSRHHHLTVLAAAWWLTGEERYADMVARHLRSWWAAQSLSVRRQLVERHRAWHSFDLLGLGAPAA